MAVYLMPLGALGGKREQARTGPVSPFPARARQPSAAARRLAGAFERRRRV